MTIMTSTVESRGVYDVLAKRRYAKLEMSQQANLAPNEQMLPDDDEGEWQTVSGRPKKASKADTAAKEATAARCAKRRSADSGFSDGGGGYIQSTTTFRRPSSNSCESAGNNTYRTGPPANLPPRLLRKTLADAQRNSAITAAAGPALVPRSPNTAAALPAQPRFMPQLPAAVVDKSVVTSGVNKDIWTEQQVAPLSPSNAYIVQPTDCVSRPKPRFFSSAQNIENADASLSSDGNSPPSSLDGMLCDQLFKEISLTEVLRDLDLTPTRTHSLLQTHHENCSPPAGRDSSTNSTPPPQSSSPLVACLPKMTFNPNAQVFRPRQSATPPAIHSAPQPSPCMRDVWAPLEAVTPPRGAQPLPRRPKHVSPPVMMGSVTPRRALCTIGDQQATDMLIAERYVNILRTVID